MSVRIGEMSVYERVGEAGFTDLVRRFYSRVRNDDLVGPMYPPADWEGSERRLRLFLIQRFGGPQTYSQERGPPMLRARHSAFPIDRAAAGRWLALMRRAMADSLAAGALSAEAAEVLWPFFVDGAEFMVNWEPSPARDQGAAG
jgi:hemoglobin